MILVPAWTLYALLGLYAMQRIADMYIAYMQRKIRELDIERRAQ